MMVMMIIFAPDITPLEYNGICYQQDRETDFEGREYAATYLSATDIQTNTLLWLVKICDCIHSPPGSPGGPIGLVDISKMTPGPGEAGLTIETTTTTRHVLDLQTRTVTLIYDPDWFVKQHVDEPFDPSQPLMPPPMPRRRKR